MYQTQRQRILRKNYCQSMITQHEKILNMHRDGKWHCQSEYWVFSKSPHKRRDDFEKHKTKFASKKINYFFQDRPCEHGIKNSHDFLLIETYIPEPLMQRTSHPSQVESKAEAQLTLI